MRILLALLLSTTTWAALPTINGKNTRGLDNMILNPSCAKSTANITDADSIVTRNTSSPLDAPADCAVDADADTEFAEWASEDLSADAAYLSGRNCVAKISYSGDASLYDFEVYIGSNKVNSVTMLNVSSGARQDTLNFPCGDLTDDPTVRVTATDNAADAINVARVYVGEADNIGTVAQAEFIVEAELTSAQTGLTSGAFSTFIPNNEVVDVYNAYNPSTGEFTVPFDSTVCVNANLEIASEAYAVGGAAAISVFVDGTETRRGSDKRAQAAGTYALPLGTSYACIPNINKDQVITVRVFNNNGTTWAISAVAARSYLQIQTIPDSSRQAVTPDLADLSGTAVWDGNTGCLWTNTSASQASFPADSDCNNPTVSGNLTAPATKIPAVIATNILPGTYKVTAQAPFLADESTSGAQVCVYRWYDGTNESGALYLAEDPNEGTQTAGALMGFFTYDSKQTDVQFEIRAERTAGNGDCFIAATQSQRSVNIVLEPLSQNTPAPILTDSVTTTGGAKMSLNTGEIDCDGAPSVISQVGDWLGTPTQTATGRCTVVIKSGVFSSAPTCTFTGQSSGATDLSVYEDTNITRTATTFGFRITVAGSDSNGDVTVQCLGPR